MENIRSEFTDWWEKEVHNQSISCKPIPIHAASPWRLNVDSNSTSFATRDDGLFYEGVALESIENQRTVNRFMIWTTARNGYHGLVVLLKVGDKFLVQAKAEAGNRSLGRVALTCTVQSSFSALNFGKPPFWDVIEKNTKTGLGAPVLQDPAMLYEKVNRVGCAEITAADFDELDQMPDNFFLATLDEIAYAVGQGVVSEHLLQTLGMFVLGSASTRPDVSFHSSSIYGANPVLS